MEAPNYDFLMERKEFTKWETELLEMRGNYETWVWWSEIRKQQNLMKNSKKSSYTVHFINLPLPNLEFVTTVVIMHCFSKLSYRNGYPTVLQ